MSTSIFITGGTGYIGSRLIQALQKEGNYFIQALVRQGSEHKLPAGCKRIFGDALNAESYKHNILPASIFVHLIGVAHPSPSKKELFQSIDAVSVREAAKAALEAGIRHFVYLSVSQYPSVIMKDYQLVRQEGERLLSSTGFKCSFIRPWYVLGPGHWWPVILLPAYWLLSLVPATREKVQQQGLVTIGQTIRTLVYAIKNPPTGNAAIYNVTDIKNIEAVHVDPSPVL